MIKLAIFATHPIQYQTPWFQKLNQQQGIDLTIYYGCIPDARQQGEDFDISFKWDIPLLDGYQWELLNIRSDVGTIKRFFFDTVQINKIFTQKIRKNTDVVIIPGWNALMLWQVLFFCNFYRIPCIVRGDSNTMRKRTSPIRCLHRLLLAQFDAFLSVGKANRKFYLQNGISRHRIFSTPHCVDNERFVSQFKKAINHRGQIRSEFGIPPKCLCFIYVGKLIAKKRVMDLLQALKSVWKKLPDVYLLIVGTGNMMPETAQFVSTNNLPVTFAGFLNQKVIIRAYVACDCLVLPSDFGETWGLVVNEAMVCGLPAIVSDRVGCGPDLIEDGVTGSVYTFGDIKALAAKMLSMTSIRKCREMGARARNRIITKYSIEKVVQGTIEAVKMVKHPLSNS